MPSNTTTTNTAKYIDELEDAIIELNQVKAQGMDREFHAAMVANARTEKIDVVFYSDLNLNLDRPLEEVYSLAVFSAHEGWDKADWDPLLDFVNGLTDQVPLKRDFHFRIGSREAIRDRFYDISSYFEGVAKASSLDYTLILYYNRWEEFLDFVLYPSYRDDIKLSLGKYDCPLYMVNYQEFLDITEADFFKKIEENLASCGGGSLK